MKYTNPKIESRDIIPVYSVSIVKSTCNDAYWELLLTWDWNYNAWYSTRCKLIKHISKLCKTLNIFISNTRTKSNVYRLVCRCMNVIRKKLETPWPESVSELYRSSDRSLPAKLVPIFAVRGWHMVSVTDLYGRILGFLDRNRYFFFQVAPQLYSRGWVDIVPDTLLLRKFGRISGSVARDSDH
jgi:hypothetical protein